MIKILLWCALGLLALMAFIVIQTRIDARQDPRFSCTQWPQGCPTTTTYP